MATRCLVGTCAFKAPPDTQGTVEIAYMTFPSEEGGGFASAMALGLVEIAVGEVMDPEDGLIWRWERVIR